MELTGSPSLHYSGQVHVQKCPEKNQKKENSKVGWPQVLMRAALLI